MTKILEQRCFKKINNLILKKINTVRSSFFIIPHLVDSLYISRFNLTRAVYFFSHEPTTLKKYDQKEADEGFPSTLKQHSSIINKKNNKYIWNPFFVCEALVQFYLLYHYIENEFKMKKIENLTLAITSKNLRTIISFGYALPLSVASSIALV